MRLQEMLFLLLSEKLCITLPIMVSCQPVPYGIYRFFLLFQILVYVSGYR